MANLASLIHSCLQILYKTQTGVFPISDFRHPFHHNSRTTNDIDITLGPVTNSDKRNTEMSKKLTMTSCQQNMTLPSLLSMLKLC